MRRRPPMRALLLVAGLLAMASACGSNDDELIVFAASSLADAMAEIEAAFEDLNPGVDVVLNLGGSSSLREQVLAGAPGDVVASANIDILTELLLAGEVTNKPVPFAGNSLVLGVPTRNEAGVTSPADLERSDLLIGLCQPQVPCGNFAAETLDRLGIDPYPDTLEPDVRSLLAKLAEGELDAGVIYATDAASSPDVSAIELPSSAQPEIRYAIATMNAELPTNDFSEFVRSAEGEAILSRHGFGP